MDELEIYTQGWNIFMPQYLDYGMKEKDFEFSMEWEGLPQKSAILLCLSKRVYQLLRRTAATVDGHLDKILRNIEVVEAPPRSNLVTLSVPDRNQLFMVQAIIALSFPLLKEEKRKRVETRKEEIDKLSYCMVQDTKEVIVKSSFAEFNPEVQH